MRQGVCAVSFGTTVDQARERDLEGVERALRAAAPDLPFYRAFTSAVVRRRLERRGIAVPSLSAALGEMEGTGVECPLIVPTHLLPGAEYDKIRQSVEEARPRFAEIRLAPPLLGTPAALRELAGLLMADNPAAQGVQTLFMGHGARCFADLVYPALQGVFCLAGRDDLLVATVEGRPTLDEVLPALSAPTVVLAPLMLVAGDHALNDMAGEGPDSWKSRLERGGRAVSCRLTGLGALPQVQDLYVRRLQGLR